MTHTVTLAELDDWFDGECREWVTFASSSKEPKSLVANLSGELRVLRGRDVVWRGNSRAEAVKQYNRTGS